MKNGSIVSPFATAEQVLTYLRSTRRLFRRYYNPYNRFVTSESVAGVDPKRYVLSDELGRGGLAVVHRARDLLTGVDIALKRMLPTSGSVRSRHEAMFQREYYALRQFSHPAIVEVYDYGVDAEGPFYTMELLDGMDLSTLAPVAWQKACELLRDVARSLAVLHSRGMLHNDVSARNVRCTVAGRAKLLDFGAMTSTGVVPELLVGTPPFLPPECVHRQPRDQRADLYSLGALGYWLLTARHAYPTMTLAELRQRWQGRVAPPSRIVSEVPAALDALIMSLLSLDRRRRPLHAGEVIDRLTAIASLDPTADAATVRAFLERPSLVEREQEVQRVQKKLTRATSGRGSAVVIEGEPGVGRTRFLEELALQSELGGAVVLRASGRKGLARFELVLELVEQLRSRIPDSTFDRLSQALAAASTLEGEERNAHTHAALTDALREFARRRTLVIAVDDAHLADESSIGVLATLARVSAEHKLIVALTVSRAGRAVLGPHLAQSAETMELALLSREGTEVFYDCVFANARYVSELAGWAYSVAGGNPAHYMELARDLVARSVIQYLDGGWMLKVDLRGESLPSTIADAYESRISRLSGNALSLAQAMWAFGDTLTAEDCRMLSWRADDAVAFAALEELIEAEVLACAGAQYSFRQQAIEEAIARTVTSAHSRVLHERIAQSLAARAPQSAREKLVLGWHFLHGHDHARGVDWVFEGIAAVRDFNHEFDPRCVEACELGLAAAEAAQRPPHAILRLRIILIACAYIFDQRLLGYAWSTIERLAQDAGVSRLSELDSSLSLRDRMLRALAAANENHKNLPEHERGLHPLESAQELTRALLTLNAVYCTRLDREGVQRAADLLQPLAAISPVALAFYETIVASAEGLRGGDAGFAILQRGLERADSLIAAGLSPVRVRALKSSLSYGLALRYAQLDPGRARELANLVEQLGEKRQAAGVAQIRLLVALVDGSTAEAENARHELENRVLTHRVHGSTGLHIPYLLRAYGLTLDLNELKLIVRELTALRRERPRYTPLLHVADGLLALARGERERALEFFDEALNLARPGDHSAWAQAVTYRIQTLIALQRTNEARAESVRALAENEEHQLGAGLPDMLIPSLALLELDSGDGLAAAARLDAAIARAREQGRARVWLGLLYETRARVARQLRDDSAFAQSLEQVHALAQATENTSLMAAARRVSELDRGVSLKAQPLASTPATATLEGTQETDDEPVVSHRARRALTVLIEQTQAHAGFVYALKDGRPSLVAASGATSPPPELAAEVREFVRTSEDRTCTLEEPPAHSGSQACIGGPSLEHGTLQRIYRRVGLSDDDEGGDLGIVVLEVDAGEDSI